MAVAGGTLKNPHGGYRAEAPAATCGQEPLRVVAAGRTSSEGNPPALVPARSPTPRATTSQRTSAALPALTSFAASFAEADALRLYLEGSSYEEMAEGLECDTKAIDNALQRVKRKILAHKQSREVLQ